jgi:hypothetical protein
MELARAHSVCLLAPSFRIEIYGLGQENLGPQVNLATAGWMALVDGLMAGREARVVEDPTSL